MQRLTRLTRLEVPALVVFAALFVLFIFTREGTAFVALILAAAFAGLVNLVATATART